jgi:hypothetical protein
MSIFEYHLFGHVFGPSKHVEDGLSKRLWKQIKLEKLMCRVAIPERATMSFWESPLEANRVLS